MPPSHDRARPKLSGDYWLWILQAARLMLPTSSLLTKTATVAVFPGRKRRPACARRAPQCHFSQAHSPMHSPGMAPESIYEHAAV